MLPTPVADGTTEFDIDPWPGGLGPGACLLPVWHLGILRQARGLRVHENPVWQCYGFSGFWFQLPPGHPRRKRERLKTEPEESWDLMWNPTLIHALFPNTLLIVHGDHVELARIFPHVGCVDRYDGARTLFPGLAVD
jgi:hypothetical protein